MLQEEDVKISEMRRNSILLKNQRKNARDRIFRDLAHLVESKECLWSFNHPDYKNQDRRIMAWLQIRASLCQMYSKVELEQADVADLRGMKHRWRTLFDIFNRFENSQKVVKNEEDPTDVKCPKFMVSHEQLGE